MVGMWSDDLVLLLSNEQNRDDRSCRSTKVSANRNIDVELRNALSPV